jgi:hypothetical protein
MGSLICNYPEHSEPLTRLEQLKLFLQPFIVRADGRDVYSQSTAKVENALAAADRDKSHFVPLVSMKRNAARYGPQYKFTIEDMDEVRATGAINRLLLSVVWNDPIPADLLSRLVAFAKTISGVMIEVEDDEGNPLPADGEQEDPVQQDRRKTDASAGIVDA